VQLLDPHNNREFFTDKLSIVDVKASDANQQMYQIEIQLDVYNGLTARMIYGWADLYSRQIKSGEDYVKLQATYSIWLLGGNLFPNPPESNYIHNYQLRNPQGRKLHNHGGIWIIELNKFSTSQVTTEQQRWIKFFIEAGQLNSEDLPFWMHTKEMRQAMSTLQQFAEKEEDYYLYQARQNFLRQQKTIFIDLEATRREKEAALQREAAERSEKEAALQREAAERSEKEAALQREAAALQAKEAALAEITRLRALLGKTE
jgi:predicted transposase/invertase (TIGR01784 family)